MIVDTTPEQMSDIAQAGELAKEPVFEELSFASRVAIAEQAILSMPHPVTGDQLFFEPDDKRMKLLATLNLLSVKRAQLADQERKLADQRAAWEAAHAEEIAGITELKDTVNLFDTIARNLTVGLYDGEHKKILPAGLAEVKTETTFAYDPEVARDFALALAPHIPGLVKVDGRKLESVILATKPVWATIRQSPKPYLATDLKQQVIGEIVLESLGMSKA